MIRVVHGTNSIMPAQPALSWEAPATGKTLPPAILRKLDAAAEAKGGNPLPFQMEQMTAEFREGELEEVVRIGQARGPGQSADWEELLVTALVSLDRHGEALERIDAALLTVESPDLRSMRVEALIKLGRKQEAVEQLDRLRNASLGVLGKGALALAIEEWGAGKALALLEDWPHQRQPAKREEFRLQCLLSLGRTEDAKASVDLGRYLLESEPAPPEGWERDVFLATLGREAHDLKGLTRDPLRYSTRGGRRTYRLLDGGPDAIEALHGLIRREVQNYADALPPDDPVARARPDRLALDSWIILHDRGGYQKPHIHPAGWLSGVFYIATSESGDDAGTLRIGLPPSSDQAPAWESREVRPTPGKIILFPSYFRHDTLPYGGTSPRICCAFDVCAA